MATFSMPNFWVQPTAKPTTGTSLQDYFQQALYNSALRYLDPMTQRETALWLSRDNPDAFAAYAGLAPHTDAQQQWLGPPQGQLPTGQDVFNIANNLTFDALKNQGIAVGNMTPGTGTSLWEQLAKEENRQARSDVMAGTGWLQEALKTAAPALGTGKYGGGATRQQQNLSAAHLNTLMQEADREPNKGGMYRTLFENIVNPITQKAPISGIFGKARSLGTPSGQFQRKGVSFRNPFLT